MISDDNYQAQSHRHFCTQEQLSLFFQFGWKDALLHRYVYDDGERDRIEQE